MKNCQILSNVVCEDFVACNIRVDSELCITRAEKFGLKNMFDNNQLKKAQKHFGRKKAREGRSVVMDKVTSCEPWPGAYICS